MAIDLKQLFKHLRCYAGLLEECSLRKLELFIRICRHFHQEIALHAPPDGQSPPHRLQRYLNRFLCEALLLDSGTVISLWDALKDYIWAYSAAGDFDPPSFSDAEREIIDKAGYQHAEKQDKYQLAMCMFYPPTRTCVGCKTPLPYSSMLRHRIVFFVAKNGLNAIQGYSTSLACGGCKIRHYHNYYLADNMRHYYVAEVPNAIQIEEHAYVEAELCELYTSFMRLAWVSQQNCSNIHNAAINREAKRNGDALNRFNISSEQVFRAFVMNALLRESAEDGSQLVLPNLGDHDDRLKCAMEARNRKIILRGQRERMHACNQCEKPIPGTGVNGLRSFRAVVMDGISLGRPCCKIHNCSKPLPNNRAHYCVEHESYQQFCVVNNCSNKATKGFSTCTLVEHRSLETKKNEKGKAFFQLNLRLQKFSQLPDSNSSAPIDATLMDDLEDDANYDTNVKKSDAGNRVPKARFARRRTHNEQIIVACCGVINARGTMHGAESISGAADFLKSVYPVPEDLPDVGFYDNNCQLQKHLEAQHDTYFKDMILPVDVFHFKSKHKTSDEYCQKNCNPAKWTALSDGKGGWIFNSSAAEQGNVWLGGFSSMVREMLAHRYDFFLDEMIKRRNEDIVERLTMSGDVPYIIPNHISTL